MTNHVYKHITITGTSPNGVKDAVDSAVAKAAKTVHNMRWFEVLETRGHIDDGKVTEWQVTIRIGFTLD